MDTKSIESSIRIRRLMHLLTYNTLIVLTGVSLLRASAGVIGTFAVIRRRSLIGDALAEVALPGICVAYLVVGERRLPAMLLGALISGLVRVGLIQGLVRMTRIKQDVDVGFVRSVFYRGGVALLVVINRQPGTSQVGAIGIGMDHRGEDGRHGAQ